MRACLSIAILLCATAGAVAQAPLTVPLDGKAAWLDPGWRRTVDRILVRVEASGLDRLDTDFEYIATDERGARAIGSQVHYYNGYFEDLALTGLATVKADGRVIPVDDRAVRDQAAYADTTSPYFDERRTKVVAFPDVEPGDRVRGHLAYIARKAVFPGAYTGVWTQPLDAPPGTMEVTVDAPASMPLHVSVRGGREDEERRGGDRVIHHVAFRQELPTPLSDATDGFDTARRFELSTFGDDADLAATLAARNAPMAIPDDALRHLSSEVVGDASTVRDKVERIHDWVARNIRYVGIGFEDGGLTSQPASAVLAARYADCKGHVVLLKALLAAQGIEADLVAVNADARYTRTDVATPSFDHAIAYVPALGLYIDPTAAMVAFGSLPSKLYGKPVLDIDRGVRATIPVLAPDGYVVTRDTRYALLPDGTRQVRSTLSGTGLGAALNRSYAAALEAIDRPQAAARVLEASGLPGSGTYSFGDPRQLSGPFAIEAPFTIAKPMDLKKPVALRLLAWTDPRPTAWQLATGGVADAAFACSSLDVREAASLDLPDGIGLFEAPGDVSDEVAFEGATAYGHVTGHATVTGKVRVVGRTVRMEVRTILAFDAPVCPASFSDAIKAAVGKRDGFANAGIGLTPKVVAFVRDSGPDAVAAYAAFSADDWATARDLWSTLAERGSADAQNNLGWMYKKGLGVGQDFSESFRMYLRSAAQGNALGQSNVAYYYLCGCGVVQSDEKAALWYERAARQGFAYGQTQLADMVMHGRGVDKDVAAAFGWYERAAGQGDLDAERTLGLLYQGGHGVQPDYDKATRWLRAAADQNDTGSQEQLGGLFAQGHALPRDDAELARLLRKAADNGDTEARYQLGWLYEIGRGVAKDLAQARAWYVKADPLWNEGARVRLEVLDQAGSGDEHADTGIAPSEPSPARPTTE